MAKMSKLEMAIKVANVDVELASRELSVAMRVRDALMQLSGTAVESTSELKVRRGRKPKGLPKGEVAA